MIPGNYSDSNCGFKGYGTSTYNGNNYQIYEQLSLDELKKLWKLLWIEKLTLESRDKIEQFQKYLYLTTVKYLFKKKIKRLLLKGSYSRKCQRPRVKRKQRLF